MTMEGKRGPEISVIVPVYDDPSGLAQCLDALAVQTMSGGRFEVIVVDNGSTCSYGEALVRFPSATLVVEPEAGSYNARNTGIGISKGEIIAFTDADCKPHPDWLECALLHFEKHPEVDAIGGSIRLERSMKPTAAELYERVTGFRQDRYVEDVGFAATANMLVRRRTLELVGLFDGSLKSSGDREWGLRMHAAGCRMDYLGDAIVAHPPRATIRQLLAKRRRLEGGFDRVPHTAIPKRLDVAGGGTRPQGIALALALLARPAYFGLGRFQAIQVMGVAALLVVAGSIERLRLMAGAVSAR